MKNRSGYEVTSTHRECTKCGVMFIKTSQMTLCKQCNCERVKSLTPQWKMHQRARQRAKSIGREFTIEVDDIVIPDTCPILGMSINVNSGRSGAYYNSPSLDRKDNSKGYTADNIHVISQKANAMKHCATNKELHMFANWILSNIPAED